MKLSDFETQVMSEIWKLGECSAPQVHERIHAQKPVTYSTVKTLIDRLERKGAIKRTKAVGRTIFFKPCIEPEELSDGLLDRLLTTVFAGNRKPLIAALLDSEQLSNDDLKYLSEQILNRLEPQDSAPQSGADKGLKKADKKGDKD